MAREWRLGLSFWLKGDDAIIDGYGPNGIAALVMRLGQRVSAWETGVIYHYAFGMIVGLTGLVTWLWVML